MAKFTELHNYGDGPVAIFTEAYSDGFRLNKSSLLIRIDNLRAQSMNVDEEEQALEAIKKAEEVANERRNGTR